MVSEQDCLRFDQVLHGEILQVCSLPHTFPELISYLQPRHNISEVKGALNELLNSGVLTFKSYAKIPGQTAFWATVGTPPEMAAFDLRVHGFVPEALLRKALDSYEIQLATTATRALVAVDDYLHPDLQSYENAPTPWMLTKPVGTTIWIGPIFQFGRKPCWKCLRLWLTPHRWLQASCFGLEDATPLPQPSFAATPATLATAAGLISTTAAIWSSLSRHPRLEGRIATLDTRTLQSQSHLLRPHPECPSCGLSATPVRELRDLLSPITGIISTLDVTDQPAGGIFHASAKFVHAMPVKDVLSVLPPQRSIGKGLTTSEAETTALAEAVERYSISWRGNEPVRRAKLAEVDALALNSIFQFSISQYEGREEWNSVHEERQRIPQSWNGAGPIDWCDVQSLVTGRVCQIPTAFCYLNYRAHRQPELYYGDTNGCAAGRSHESATLAALLELIERDALAIWWYNRLRRPAIDFDSFHHNGIAEIRAALSVMGRVAHLLDITTDVGIPCFVAVMPNCDGTHPCFGAAANHSPATAAFRALSEAVQVWFWAKNLGGSPALKNFLQTAVARGNSYLAPNGLKSSPPELAVTVSEALDSTVNRLFSCGLECFRLDCTRREAGIPVVRVIAPGLRHFWARFGSGRLYEVPVKLGWRDKPLREEDLNPIPCMI